MADSGMVNSLKIYIKPPWYLSTLAKLIYFLLLCAAVFGIYRYFKWRWTMKLNLRLTEEEAGRLKKLHDLKAKLYTDIAHEFKTPLTLISGPIESYLSDGKLSDSDKTNFSFVQRNADRLTCLVDQLLELAKLEDGKLNMKVSEGDLGLLLQTISQSFQFRSQSKNINYEVAISNLGMAWYDEDVIEKIIGNLLSNALKYTPSKGICHFSAEKNKNRLSLSVKNTVLNASSLPLGKIVQPFLST